MGREIQLTYLGSVQTQEQTQKQTQKLDRSLHFGRNSSPPSFVTRQWSSACGGVISPARLAPLVVGGLILLSPAAFAQPRHGEARTSVIREAPLSPEAQVAVASVLRTLRSRASAEDPSLLALALEVSRTPELVTEALVETRASRGELARAILEEHANRILELRASLAARSTVAGRGRGVDTRTDTYLDELTAALDRSAREEGPTRRADQLEDLIGRMQSGDLPVHQSVPGSRSPTFVQFQGDEASKPGTATAPGPPFATPAVEQATR